MLYPRRQMLRLTCQGLTAFGAAILSGAPGDAPWIKGHEREGSATTRSTPRISFPLGVFEDGNILNGNATTFEAMVNDLQWRSFDSVLFTNNSVARDGSLLDVSDRHQFNVYFAPSAELNSSWWQSHVAASRQVARQVIAPIVDKLQVHPSLRGYALVDEPGLDLLNKVALATETFHQLDPTRLVIPTLIGIDRVGPIFEAAMPDVLLLDVYPVARNNPIGNFAMTAFGYPYLDFVSYIRLVSLVKPSNTPLWVILQTHKFGDEGSSSLRQPTPAEVRAQHWLAVGEGATGIFWFIYSSQQGWTGLKDNPTLYDVVTDLANRLRQIRSTLATLHRDVDLFTVSGSGPAYVSTLTTQDRGRQFAVVVNRNCDDAQTLSVDAPGIQANLRDIETGQTSPLGSSVILPPGDGRIYELVGQPNRRLPNQDLVCPENTTS